MSLVFVAAEAREFSGFMRHLTDIRKLSWPLQFGRTAQMNGRGIVMLANGPGPHLAALASGEASKRLDKVDAFISTGYCGALDGRLEVGSIVVGTDVNGAPVLKPSTQLSYTAGSVVSNDRVASTIEEKSKLGMAGAIAVEMEAAGVEQIARNLNVPFYCVRAVTDAASDALALDFNKVRDRNGRFSRMRIVRAACRDPLRVVPELMKLQRNSQSASKALGDFIADCRF